MFGRDKDKTPIAETAAAGGKVSAELPAPPIKPFSKNGPASTPISNGAQTRPDIPRRVAEIPGAPRRAEPLLPADDEANRLTVGRNICLNGEITSCEKLVVEGRVEASIYDARVIEISQTGYFKGNAEVDEADISGHFEGNLVARRRLTIRKNGHVNGSVRYGRIIIESGGEISGDMASLEDVPSDYSPIPERVTKPLPGPAGSSN
ncbi:MAG: polymer-forming cytoskeletal protein [Proteobacteria bacterium]|nr:polymer-forming cytoskeletal protein [Pseudomonadota bacterium]